MKRFVVWFGCIVGALANVIPAKSHPRPCATSSHLNIAQNTKIQKNNIKKQKKKRKFKLN